MQVNFKPNKKIFAIFLLINAAGYSYENSKDGMHPVRIKFTERVKKMGILQDAIKEIQNLPLSANQYIRLVNYVMFFNEDEKYQKFRNLFDELVGTKEMDDLFQEYCVEVEKLAGYDEKKMLKQFEDVVVFFDIKENVTNVNINVYVHVNLLESYSRGTNYYSDEYQYISCSLNLKDQMNENTLKHEFMHILLKKILPNNFLQNENFDIPTNKNYQNDSLRTKFDENFILAANLFFLNLKEKQKNNLKFYSDQGFAKIDVFYNFIKNNFVESKNKLDVEIVQKLVNILSR